MNYMISFSDMKKRAKARQAALDMLKLATESKAELKSLPAGLRQRANEILYG